jgi:hypothetical protein
MTKKTLTTLSTYASAWIISALLCAWSITPDACWPNEMMIGYLTISSLLAVVFIIFPLAYLLKANRIHWLLRACLSLPAALFLSGFFVRESMVALVEISKRGSLSDPSFVCFTNLGSNYLDGQVDIFWTYFLVGLAAALLLYLLNRTNRIGDSTGAV